VKESKRQLPFLIICVIVIALAAVVFPSLKKRGSRIYESYLPTTTIVQAAERLSWNDSFRKVKEDRGEATGKQVRIDVPRELRHYSDSRRFLAMQVAESREHQLRTPGDFVDLAKLIRAGELVPVPTVSDSFILLGVGGSANSEPFSRFYNGKSIELYDQTGLKSAYQAIASSRARVETELASLRKELSSLGRRERSRRAAINSKIATKQAESRAAATRKQILDQHYGSTVKQAALFDAYKSLAQFASSFPERSFQIESATERRELKRRMLAFLRPEALAVMKEIADSYYGKFGRPLPISSLVRPDEYQLKLSKTNPNATLIDTPPHSTGLAFDVFYGYMTATEQEHVMRHLAQLEDAGRIEVLRENRNHYHVFAFIDGARPDERFIGASLSRVGARKAHAAIASAGKAVKSKKRVVTERRKSRKPRRR
jgi:DNA-binding transcriptional ArsR family regulator